MKKPIPFGKYYLLDRIAVGGMAEVFKAKVMREEGFEKLFAIKRILPSIAEDDEFIKMFIDEAKIAVQLTHANIAQILDLGKVGDAFFIAMEYVHGKDLRSITDVLKKKGENLQIPMCCYIMMKVCEGLDYAHNKKDAAGRELNLVHRDVSPQNVLLSFDGEIKLIDFGIAKAANKAAKTQAGILKGKFGYMSPEQVRGLPLDKRSDVFSVGIVLYEVLTGERLFLGESDFSTLEKVRNVEIMPPSTYNRNIPEELEQIVLKALAREVEDRYQTGMELHDDLQSFMYTFGDLFGRKELSAFLKEEFKAAWESDIEGVGAEEGERPAERSGRSASTPPPPRRSAPPPPPRLSRSGPSLRGSVPPPPPRARASTPPPPPPKKTVMGMPAVTPPGMSGPPPAAPGVSAPPEPTAPPSEPSQPSAPMALAPEASQPSAPMAPAPDASQPSAPVQPQQPVAAAAPPGPGAQIGATPPPGAPTLLGPAGGVPVPAPAGTPQPMAAGPPGLQEPAGIDMEWDDDEMETQIYDKLPEDQKIPGIGEEDERPAMPMAAPQIQAPPATVSIPPALPARPRSSAPIIIVALILVAGLLIGGLILLFLGKTESSTLVLIPEPSGATVTLDSEPVLGPFPVTITDLDPGPHKIVASHDEYDTLTLDIEIEAGKVSTQSIKLVRKKPKGTGFIMETEPLGADVIINNRKHPEKTPLTVSDLKPGTYTLRVEKAGFLPFSTDINVVDGKLLQLDKVVLDPRSVQATITTDPSDAKITLVTDGKEKTLGSSPQELELDPAKQYSLKIEAPEHKEWIKKLEMPKGDNKLSIEAKLDPVEAEAGAEETSPREPGEGATVAKKGTGKKPGGKKPGGKKPGGKKPGGKKPGGEKKPVAKAGFGFLSVSTQPWTIVYVDKKKVKNTPLMKYKLPAGKHSVTLLNNDFNIRKTYTVIIAPGQETRIIKNLTK